MIIGILYCTHTTAQQLHHLQTYELIERQYIDPAHAATFATLQVQDFQGRIKPIGTLALELLRKIYKKSTFRYTDHNGEQQHLSPTQVFIGMQYKPDSWQLIECIKIEKNALAQLSEHIQVNTKGYSNFAQFFDFQGNYKLRAYVSKAYETAPGKRTTLDKDILKIDERINILLALFNKQFLKCFPLENAPNQKWYAPEDVDATFQGEARTFFQKIIPTYFSQLDTAIQTRDWDIPNQTLALLHNFQKKHGSQLIRSDQKVALELWFHKATLFFKCLIGYSIFGTLLLINCFIHLFSNRKKTTKRLLRINILLIAILFIIHGIGIGIRWYISGHAPWSNGYEASVFISWIGILAGLIFCKKNAFPLAAATILAMCLLGIAHGSLMNPEITNLVPVLKSHWLLIHVAVITSSYGFLAIGSFLAIITLLLMSVHVVYHQQNTQQTIEQLTKINQMTTIIGLYMLTIGTFLGGVWANESWGRYWGWDPKETWALISIIIYAFVVHLRIMSPKNHIYSYNICSLFALGSLIMTFFGVNYYLSGLHSYAKGDAFPIPMWIYIAIPLLIIISILPFVLRKTVISKVI